MKIGALPDGRAIDAVEIVSTRLRATILTYGARLHEACLDASPNLAVVSPDIAGYLGVFEYHGALVGPVANRIAGASARIEGQEYHFEANQDDRHSLHSGRGIHGDIWSVDERGEDFVTLSLGLPDGKGGFPGDRRITATYRAEGADLRLDLAAKTDAPTLMNLAHHGYWNLDGSGDWSEHRLEVMTDRYLPVDAETLPTGAVASVVGTPYDHRNPRAPVPSLDHNFCFERVSEPRTLARLIGASGRALEVISDAPGLQVYAGAVEGIALEPQLWPDAPHHSEFPPIVLRPGETFRQTTIFRLTG